MPLHCLLDGSLHIESQTSIKTDKYFCINNEIVDNGEMPDFADLENKVLNYNINLKNNLLVSYWYVISRCCSRETFPLIIYQCWLTDWLTDWAGCGSMQVLL